MGSNFSRSLNSTKPRLKSQTQIHFLNNCTSAVNDGRFKWRHNSILKTILFYLTSTNDYDVFADVEGYRSSAVLFNVIELTVCFETNL